MRLAWITIAGLVACGKVNSNSVDASVDGPDAPMVVAVTTPPSIEADGSMATIMAVVHGHPNEALKISFSGTNGTYGPPTSIATTDASGNVTVSTTFVSGAAGTENGTVTASNAAMVTSAPKSFSFPIIALTRYGATTPFAASGAFGQDNLLGETITVGSAGTLKKIGFISLAAGPMIKVGIYANGNNLPTTLLAQLPATDVVMGMNEVALTTPLMLAAGTYWFLADYNLEGMIGSDQTQTRMIRYVSEPFATALPLTFPPMSQTYMGGNFNYYLVFGQ